ncbi:hypothetical protein BO70DRAFT_178904 [Aspergillus heteromorphus CBS 117.55]|uniref:HTH APSES-type domain-containing protein n=1 Tax=Aspergillus heteromorphus CBS 117.55 TaxID=1448321 RepID=A0A317WPF0_9EURO|nr:uncharacterized protein BO70DRAFT_178904 [Aspergillus heteromorphus CBS 117.55]PWY88309.1 hypothetical protein BO70DRAFT_178904 [Aspergillus heteromorphus CBS 117.55]
MRQNLDLARISYSITGGNLLGQGYWVPWEAARELAATFCWKIRHALTPVFGTDFPSICIPKGHKDFGNYRIPKKAVERATFLSRTFRSMELGSQDRPQYLPTPAPSSSPRDEESSNSNGFTAINTARRRSTDATSRITASPSLTDDIDTGMATPWTMIDDLEAAPEEDSDSDVYVDISEDDCSSNGTIDPHSPRQKLKQRGEDPSALFEERSGAARALLTAMEHLLLRRAPVFKAPVTVEDVDAADMLITMSRGPREAVDHGRVSDGGSEAGDEMEVN